MQLSGTPSALEDADVDKYCSGMLEEDTFEKSARVGIASHRKWGLDAGDHCYWNTYAGSPWS